MERKKEEGKYTKKTGGWVELWRNLTTELWLSTKSLYPRVLLFHCCHKPQLSSACFQYFCIWPEVNNNNKRSRYYFEDLTLTRGEGEKESYNLLV